MGQYDNASLTIQAVWRQWAAGAGEIGDIEEITLNVGDGVTPMIISREP